MATVAKADRITSTAKKREIYSDFFTSFVIQTDKKDLLKNVNEEAVKRSIRNIILTNHGERPFNPNFGGNIRAQLFELMTPQTEDVIRSEITSTISQHEPRARVVKVDMMGDEVNNGYFVTIVFSLINTGVQHSVELFLARVR